MKTILIAIPTNKNVEVDTFKSIYDLEIPEGYRVELQFFYGYQVDQIRNLIAHWAIKFDYLFAVDSDMAFPSDTLQRLLAHNVDVVSGLYIQRKPGQHILELYRNGINIPYQDIKGLGLIEVDSCGFGCVLVNSNVLRTIGYPQFVYRSAIDHSNTISEDTFFCMKAREKGFRIYADTTILCDHIGSTRFVVDTNPAITPTQRLVELSNQRLLPREHVNYLFEMKKGGVEPKVVYDIGACVLHWTREAVGVWPTSKYYAFEAMEESAAVFQKFNVPYFIGVLSSEDDKEVTFYQNTMHPGGNSYYKENSKINKNADAYYNDATVTKRRTVTLDAIVKSANLPLPDLIKMDVQGAELDVLKGASQTLLQCKDLILELQNVEYNKGAPLCDDVISYLEELGFEMKTGPFCNNGPDGDYHFSRK